MSSSAVSGRWQAVITRFALVLLLAASRVHLAQAQVISEIGMRTSNSPDMPLTRQFTPQDTFYLFFRVDPAVSGEASVVWYFGQRQLMTSRRTLVSDKRNLSFYLQSKVPWEPGTYLAAIYINGRQVGSESWVVSANPQNPSVRPVAPQQYNGRGSGAQEVAGRWVCTNPKKQIAIMSIAPNGSYDITAGGERFLFGQMVASRGQMNCRVTTMSDGRTADRQFSYALRGDLLIVRNPDGTGISWYRDSSPEGVAILGGTPAPVPTPTPRPTPIATVEQLKVTGTFKRSTRDEGPQDPSSKFGAYEDIHCGLKGTLKKGSQVEALLRDGEGRQVMKMTLNPMAKDGAVDRYAIPFRHPKEALPPGDYTIQVLLNGQDVGKPLKITISGTPAIGGNGVAVTPRTESGSMRDLVKTETAPAIQAARSRPGRRYALLIGVSQYDNPGVQKLAYPVEDMKAVRTVLQDPASGGFAPADVHVLSDAQATLVNMGSQLVWLRGVCTENDTVLIYFSGHGYNNGSRSYLGTANTDPDNLNFTALSVAKFNEGVALIKAKKKIIILDACHSGGMLIAARGDDKLSPQMAHELNERAEGEVRLLSCSKDETSKEDPKLGHGVFTHFLVKGMGPEKAADANRDGVVTVGELCEYLSTEVRRYGADHGYIQTPSAEQKVRAGVIIMSTKWK